MTETTRNEESPSQLSIAALEAAKNGLLTPDALVVGDHYNWRGQTERLAYLCAKKYPGDSRTWFLFERIDDPGKVWCEVLGSDIPSFETSKPVQAEAPSDTTLKLAEMILADCGHSTAISTLLRDRVAERIERHFAAHSPASGVVEREAFTAYLKDCDDHCIQPDVAGAFAYAWRAALATQPLEQKPVAQVTHSAPDNYGANHRIKWLTQQVLPVGTNLFAAAQPEQVAQDSRPTEPGLYAWVPDHGSPSLVLVGKRPSAHCGGGVLNGQVLDSSKFYDGCAMTSWPAHGWVNLRAARASGQEGGAA